MTSRERRLIVVLALLAAVAAVGIALSPRQPPSFEEVVAYYVSLFESAEAVTIRSADGSGEPVTVTREDAPSLFNHFAMLTRSAGVSPSPPPFPPRYVLDVRRADGTQVTDVLVGLHLDAPRQPGRGKLWVIPRGRGGPRSGPDPAMADAIQDYLDPEGAEERREARRQAMGAERRGPGPDPSPETPGQ